MTDDIASVPGKYAGLRSLRAEMLGLLHEAGKAFPDGGALKQAAMLLYAVEDGILSEADDEANIGNAVLRAREVMLAVVGQKAGFLFTMSAAWAVIIEGTLAVSLREGIVTEQEATQALQAAIKQAKRLAMLTARANKLASQEPAAPSTETQQ